jgi:hypothetical protein
MATSGTTTFNLDIFECIEEAYEMVGIEMRSGYEMRTARRSLNLMMREWGNRGVNFWTIRETEVAASAGDTTLSLPTDCIDVLDAAWRVGTGLNQNDRIMTRMSMVDYAQMANKNQPGEPTQFWVQRVVPPVVTIWPVPVSSGTFVFWGLRSIQDVGAYGNTMDLPQRFLPAMTSGLAYYLALKTPGAEQKAAFLKGEYDRQFTLAEEEDRERTPFKMVPDMTGYG